MTNYPPLLINVLGHLQTEIVRKAFLWACDAVDSSKMKYPAEQYAVEVDNLVLCLKPWLEFSAAAHNAEDEIISGLLAFILRRHLILSLPQTRRFWV